jgi:hypothetical protein
MTKELMYTYLGTNGSVTTPIHLEGVPAMKKVRIKPAIGKRITNGTTITESSVIVAESEVANWKEI